MSESNGHQNGHTNGHASNGNGSGGLNDYFEPPLPTDVVPVDPTCDPLEPDPEDAKNVYLISPLVAGEWKPSQRQCKIYEALCETGDYKRVAEAYRTTIRQVELLARKIDAWVKSQHLDEIWSVRVRQKKYLENLFARAINGFEKSTGDEVTTVDGFGPEGPVSKTTVKHRGEGNPAFLSLAREILKDIRELTGANKAPADLMAGNTFSVSQFNSRREAIVAHMSRMEAALTSLGNDGNVENN